MTTISTYLSVARDLPRWRGVAEKTPEVALETKYFRTKIATTPTIEAFLKDRRLFNYAMKAFGLGDRAFAVGLMRRALEQGASEPKALARTMNDQNILSFVRSFEALRRKEPISTKTVAEIADRYVDQAMRAAQGKNNPGVELALYFREKAPKLTSIYGVLADRKLLEVVQTTLGLSQKMSAQQIDTQARLLSARVKIEDFRDARKLEGFIARFAANYDMLNLDPGAMSPTLALFGTGAQETDGNTGVDFSLILRRQNAGRVT
jgi:hypothetical protein